MDKEQLAKKLSSLIQNSQFVLKLAEIKSDEEAVKLFKDNNCELEAEKIKFIRDTLNNVIDGKAEISESDLENVSGGVSLSKALSITLGLAVVYGVGQALSPAAQPERQLSPTERMFEELPAEQQERIRLMMITAQRPGLLSWAKGMFSSDAYARNLIAEATANKAADELVALRRKSQSGSL